MAKAVRTTAASNPKEKKTPSATGRIERVLITQARPEGEKSPYFDLAKKFDLTLDFHPFIRVEGLSGKEFRRQKVDLNEYTAIVFTSRLAVDHFFRIMEEMKMKVNQDLKYFCITEAVALYLQKFILYRKRKVFFSADGSTQGLLDVIGKHKNEKYVVPMADSTKKEIPAFMAKYKIPFAEASLYRTVSNDIAPVLDQQEYDMIVFFSPFSIQALYEYNEKFAQNGTVIGAFGPTTTKAVEEAGLRLDIKAPAPNAPSMVNAMELYLANPAAFAPPAAAAAAAAPAPTEPAPVKKNTPKTEKAPAAAPKKATVKSAAPKKTVEKAKAADPEKKPLKAKTAGKEVKAKTPVPAKKPHTATPAKKAAPQKKAAK